MWKAMVVLVLRATIHGIIKTWHTFQSYSGQIVCTLYIHFSVNISANIYLKRVTRIAVVSYLILFHYCAHVKFEQVGPKYGLLWALPQIRAWGMTVCCLLPLTELWKWDTIDGFITEIKWPSHPLWECDHAWSKVSQAAARVHARLEVSLFLGQSRAECHFSPSK